MARLASDLEAILVTLWVGSLWTVGFLVAPTLFASLQDRGLAGEVAGRLFVLEGWLGLTCFLGLVLIRLFRQGRNAPKTLHFWLVVAMGGLVAAGHFGVQPIMATLKAEAWPEAVMNSLLKERFATWHGISSGLYVFESLLGLGLVALRNRARGAS